MKIYNSTFSANTANAGGGGVYNQSQLSLYNTIIANSNGGSDCANLATTSGNNNLIKGSNACGLLNGVNGNIIGVDPNLGPLANNGGSTQTMALLPGSPAINAGDDAICTASPVSGKDQRGVTRPSGAHCDIGAFELFLGEFLPVIMRP